MSEAQKIRERREANRAARVDAILETLSPEQHEILIEAYLDEDLYEIRNGWRWYCYRVSPMDYGWGFLKTIKEVRQEMASLPEECEEDDYLLQFEKAWESAQQALRKCGYDGNPRCEKQKRVFAIPAFDDCAMKVGFIIKQDDDETTFVVSPYAIPHLKED